jgi:hypothetical protein
MQLRGNYFHFAAVLALGSACVLAQAQAPANQSSSSPSTSTSAKHHLEKPAAPRNAGIDDGAVTNDVYRNKSLGMSFKIPVGWVLRTEEMNGRGDESSSSAKTHDVQGGVSGTGERGWPHDCSKVLLAAFSRPPEAKGEDVNSSLLVAVESAASYPGLKEAAQYFGPLTEVAKAQGFAIDEEPYEIAVGGRILVRGDFHKDVGSRVMRQSSLVMLSHGYAVSITVIGGTEDEVEELIDGLTFAATGK